ncbi:cell division protein DivIVA [Streptomyces sp. NPDC006733]|uniref:cell division protein DivIVA n=1 Tax=Streptomyces sp. NPDC006733 TaxID=3155460 RepID=UPI0033F5084D
MFWFMLIALVAVVAAVALAVLGDGGTLRDADPDRIDDRLPADRPLVRSDIDALRLPVAVRGYRMLDADEVLDRLAAELAERDARIADLEAALAGAQATALATPSLLDPPLSLSVLDQPPLRPDAPPSLHKEQPEDHPHE